MANSDPFLTAESDLSTLLTQTRQLLSSYTRISSSSPSLTSPELLSARSDLLSSLEDLASDLQDLTDAVKAVESDPYRYGLDVAEVERRRRVVSEVGREVEAIRESVMAHGPQGQGRGHGQDKGKGRAGSVLPPPDAFVADDSDNEIAGDEDGDYAQFEEQRQQEMLEEQDEALDGVFKTVGNLRMQADEMGRELEEQGELLDSVDGLADRVGGKLNEGIKKVQWVIKKNEDTASSCCIAILIMVLIILLVLVLIL